MEEKKVVVSRGSGFCGLLTVAFIVLKLVGVISWSWWWVLAPLWIPVAIYLLCFVAGLIVAFIQWLVRGY